MSSRIRLFSLFVILFAASVMVADDLLVTGAKIVPTSTPVMVPAGPFTLLESDGSILSCSKRGQLVCEVRNMPLLLQTDPRVDWDLRANAEVGCYDTSILTVILTAEANRDRSYRVIGRTRKLLSISAGEAPKAIEQLAQEYRWAMEGQQGKIVNGKAVQPLYLTEALADTADGKIAQNCDPFVYGSCAEASNAAGHTFRNFVSDDHVTNEYVIGLMKQNYVALIAFARYSPILALPTGKLQFVNNAGRHKVVFSGFRSGSKYPLRINDVGSGTVRWARLAHDLSERGFSKNVPYPTATKTYLEFEGDGTKTGDQVFFIEHIDALKINTPSDIAAIEAAKALAKITFPGK